MQRNSFYQTYLKYILIFLLLVVYESLTSIYLYLSPLYGVAFYFIIKHIYDKEYLFRISLAFLYIFVIEIDKGFIPLSFLLFFAIYYYFIMDKIERFFSEKTYKIFFHILNAYIGYYLLNLTLGYLFGFELPSFEMRYFLYIVIDFLVTAVIL